VNWLRVFFVGGVTSYRALFGWINPWVFLPLLVIYPVFQVLFFAYLGRAADVESDQFFLVGNSFVAAAVAALFGLGNSVGGERRTQTLPMLIVSPASRLALFGGRAVPTILNGFFVAAISFALGAAILRVHVHASDLEGYGVALALSCFSCAALGLCIGALGIRGRNVSLFADIIAGSMLLVAGANVPLDRLPGWLQAISSAIPLTHGIEAARRSLSGASVSSLGGLLETELAIGVAYFVAGILLLRLFEYEGRRTATLETY
jgi:ABC-2 type transport system permease protein